MAASTASKSVEVIEIPIGKVKPDPDNPRRLVDVDDEFVASIKAKGILQPIIVRTGEKPAEYVINFGERRWTGAKKAGLKTVPCIVRDDMDPAGVFEAQVMENVHRSGLTPLEEARAYVRLVDEFKIPQRQLVEKVGKSQAYLSKHMSLALRLPDAGQRLLDSGGINVSEAILLASLHEHEVLVEEVVEAYKSGGDGHGSGPRVLGRALEQAKRAKVVMAARKKLEDAGVTIVTTRPGWQASVGAGSSAFGVQVDPAAHETEPCHVAYIDLDGDVLVFCTDRDRHRPEGDSDLKAPNLAPPPPPDVEDPVASFAAEVERGAGQMPATLINGKTPDEWNAEQEQRRAEIDAARALHGDIAEIRRAFLRQRLTADTFTVDDIARAFISRTFVIFAVDSEGYQSGGTQPELGGAADLLGVECDDEADAAEYEFGPNAEGVGLALLADPRSEIVALAIALSVAESRLGRFNRWDEVVFADVTIRQHYDYLAALGYPLHDEEQKALDAGASYRRVNTPHLFESTGENADAGVCDTCGRGLGATAPNNFDIDIHTDAAERLAAIAEAEAADTDPVYDEFVIARDALNDPANKKGAARTAAHLAFSDAKDRFAARLVDDIPFPATAADQLEEIAADHADRIKNVGPIRGGQHFAEDTAAYQALTDRVLAVLETAGPLPAVLHNAIRDRYEIREEEPPHTRAGTVKHVHLVDLVELLRAKAELDTTGDFEFASTIPDYFDLDDDQATNQVARWVEDHQLDAPKLTMLLRVEQANEDAIDRPFLRAAIVKLLASALSGVTVQPVDTATDDTPADEPSADDTPAPPELTKARLAGLTVLAFGHAHHRTVTESNTTSTGDIAAEDITLTVYWQASKWLTENGYADKTPNGILTLTDAGHALAADHDVLDGLVG